MTTYTVVMVHDASSAVEVEATSFDEAVEKALESGAARPSICHYCSGEIELGGIIRVMAENQETGEEYEE